MPRAASPIVSTAATGLLLLGVGGATGGPTTAPAGGPSTQGSVASDVFPADAPARRWFAELADPDPIVRDRAQTDLMGLSRDDLPRLRALVRASQPLPPAQAVALREVVRQAFLAGEKYVAMGDPDDPSHSAPAYMLGLRWNELTDGSELARFGVPVEQRWAGFPSYRWLREGDLILGVYVDPALPLEDPKNMPTHSQMQLANFIGGRTTRHLTLEVLRNGQPLRVPIELAPRPAVAAGTGEDRSAVDTFLAFRDNRAEAYWQEQFVPLLGPDAEASIAVPATQP